MVDSGHPMFEALAPRRAVTESPEPSALPASPSIIDEPASNPFGAERRTLRKRVAGVLVALGALAAKFATALKAAVLLLPKVKLFATAGTALVSVAAYALFWGWSFAVGLVALLFVHEMGHVIQLRREGMRATAPRFIPFLGAFIKADLERGDALTEARVGLAGPIVGTLGTCVCLVLYAITRNEFFKALAYVGFLLNLFNLLPVVPLDGGRAMAAMAPWMWGVGFVLLIATAFILPNPIMIIIVVFAGIETYRRWRQRRTRSIEQAAYYRVSPRNRALVAVVYIGLVVALALGMHATYLARSIP
jgi:Zn-dependent protease